MEVTRSIEINKPIDDVWEVAAHQFADIGQWASMVTASHAAPGEGPAGGPAMAGRACETKFGKTSEIFTHFDAAQHTFTYAAEIEKQPGFIKDTSNTWKLESIGVNKTRLSMTASSTMSAVMGAVMKFPMGRQMGKMLDLNLEEIKHYIETGRPHPRKVEAAAAA